MDSIEFGLYRLQEVPHQNRIVWPMSRRQAYGLQIMRLAANPIRSIERKKMLFLLCVRYTPPRKLVLFNLFGEQK